MRTWKGELSAIGPAGPGKIGVHESIRTGQQARGFRRGMLSQLDGKCDCRGYDYDCESDGESAPNSHAMRVRNEMIAPSGTARRTCSVNADRTRVDSGHRGCSPPLARLILLVIP